MSNAPYSVMKKVNGEIRPLPHKISEELFCADWIKNFMVEVRVSFPKTNLVIVKNLANGKVKEVKDLSRFSV